MVEALRFENGLIEFIQLREIKFFECFDLENAFQESILASPRFLNGEVVALFLVGRHSKLAERVVEVPSHKLQLLGLGIEIDVVVLADGQDTIERGKPNCDRHETREFVQVQIIAELGREFSIVGLRDQFTKLDDSPLLLNREIGFGIVGFVLNEGLSVIAFAAGDENKALI